MSHVDEGRLAEYLDGQLDPEGIRETESHLAGCAECRALLAEARRQRDHVRAILRTSGARPSARPSFEEVLARSKQGARQREQRRTLSKITSLAWAATVVLAVAVGWYARGALVGKPAPTLSEEDTRVAATVRAAPPAPAPAPAEATQEAPAPARSQASDKATSRALPPSVRDRLQTVKVPVPAAAPQGAGAGVETAPPARKDEPAAAASQDQQAPAAAPTPAPAPAGLQMQARDETKASAPKAEKNESAARKRAPAPAAAFTEGAASQELRKASFDVWTDASEADATRVLGRAPLVIDGLAVAAYMVNAEGSAIIGVRQTLPSGTEVILFETMRGVPATGQVTVERNGVTVTARAGVTADSLRALLRGLR